MSLIITESIGPGVNRVWDIEKIIYQEKTPYQHTVIAKTAQGMSLFCNNERQSVEDSQLIYHEGQIIPAALLCGEINRVLIVGSSEGVISKMAVELGAKQIIHVDIDAACVEACAKYLPYGYTEEDVQQAKDNIGPITIVIDDGYHFIDDAIAKSNKFDIVVLDLPDEQTELAQQNRLYSRDFYSKIEKILTPEGVCISQAGCTTYWRNNTLKKALSRFQNSFLTTVFFEMEAQNWVWLIGANFKCDNILERMTSKLNSLPFIPNYIDSTSIVKSTILPVSLRR